MSQKKLLLFLFLVAEALLASTAACKAVSVPDRGEVHVCGGGDKIHMASVLI
jgi:hypothetical protein